MLRRCSRPAHLLQRVLALGGILVVLALTVLASSPALHAKLHPANHAHDEGCAVTLFANGVSSPVPLVAVAPLPVVAFVLAAPRHDELLLEEPAYLRLPERGPPARG